MPTKSSQARKALYGPSPRHSRLGSDRGSPAVTPAAWSSALIGRADGGAATAEPKRAPPDRPELLGIAPLGLASSPDRLDGAQPHTPAC
jgi:hypothetical protein